jgi:import inner membrane translocase subunit TIM8
MADLSAEEQQALQGMLMQEQQRAAVQEAILKLTDICWDKCVSSPSGRLSSRESDCVGACVGRYLDTSQFIAKRLFKGAQ